MKNTIEVILDVVFNHTGDFFHATPLPSPDHVHHLVSLQGSPGALEGKEVAFRLKMR